MYEEFVVKIMLICLLLISDSWKKHLNIFRIFEEVTKDGRNEIAHVVEIAVNFVTIEFE